MKLRFYARDGFLANVPGTSGQYLRPRYVGRKFVQADGKSAEAHFPATEEPHEVDSEKLEPRHLAHWKRLCQRDEIWSADRETANFCNDLYVDVEYDVGGYKIRTEDLDKRLLLKANPHLSEQAAAAEVRAAAKRRAKRQDAAPKTERGSNPAPGNKTPATRAEAS